MKKYLVVLLALVFCGALTAGCSSQKASVDLNRPVTEIVAEAKTLTVTELKKIATDYQKALEAKKVDITALQSKIKEIPMAQLLGEDAKKLKTEISALTVSISALTERMNVYLKELKAKGATL